MQSKCRRAEPLDDPSEFLLPLKGLELVLSRWQPQILALDHVGRTLTDMIVEHSAGSMERATQAKLPTLVHWLAAKLHEERKESGKSAPLVYREARFLAGVFDSAKVGSVELIQAWFSYLPEAKDRGIAKIFEAAVREGHVILLEWLLAEGKLTDKHMISSAINTNPHVIEWMQKHFPNDKLTVSFDKLVGRWTGPETLGFIKDVWSRRKQFKKIEVSVYAKSMAATRGDLETVKWLDTIHKGACHVWAVRLAAENGHVDTFQWLLENVYSDRIVTDPKRTFKWVDGVLRKAIKEGHLEIVRLLRHRSCYEPVNLAVLHGHFDMIKWFHEKGDIKPDWIRLSDAALNGRLDIIEWLHENGVSCSAYSMENAALGGHLNIVQWLHARGFRCSTVAIDNAARTNRLDIIKWLHQNRSEGCTTAAMDKAASLGYLDIVIWLHENRKEGCTKQAVIGAASNGHLEMIQWLHLHRCTDIENHALCVAVRNGHFPVAHWLHNLGRRGCCSIMTEAVQFGNLEMLKWVFKIYPESGHSNLINDAIRCGHLKILRWLIANRIGVIRGYEMEEAARRNHLAIVKWLHEKYPAELLPISTKIGRYMPMNGI